MEDLLPKIEVLLQALPNKKRFVSYNELEERTRAVVGTSEMAQSDKYKKVLEFVCTYCIDTKDHMFLSRLYGGSNHTSLLADMIISYFNTNVHTYACSPLFTVTENLILEKIIGYIGYGNEANGVFLPGGSYCTLMAMICARHRKYPSSKLHGLSMPIQVITSLNSHYSVDKGMIMMGCGTDNVLKMDYQQTSVEEFEELVAQHNIFLINCTFGTTSQGTLESVEKFSGVIKKYGIWLHIDACQGTTALFSTKYRHLTSSFRDADSITLDAHKGMGIGIQCSALILQQGQLLTDCSKLDAPYLFHCDDENDISNRSFQCGRRADGFKLWFCDQLDDLDAHATMIYDRITEFKGIVATDSRYIPVHPDSPTHICFKLDTQVTVDIYRITAQLRKSNIHLEYYTDFFRIVPVNPNVTAVDLNIILNKIYEIFLKNLED